MREVCALGGEEAGALAAKNQGGAGHDRYSATAPLVLGGRIHISGRLTESRLAADAPNLAENTRLVIDFTDHPTAGQREHG